MARRNDIDEKHRPRLNELRQIFVDACNTDFGPLSPPRDWEKNPWNWIDQSMLIFWYLDEVTPDWRERLDELLHKASPVKDLLGLRKPYNKKRPTGRSAEATAAPSPEGE